MSKESRAITCMLCCLMMALVNTPKAFAYTLAETENCYVVFEPKNIANDKPYLYAQDWQQTRPYSYLLSSPQQTKSHETLPAYLWTDLLQRLAKVGDSLDSFDLGVLPIPASLLFISLWLIGFKLTSHPIPSLNRVETSHFNKKVYVVMSISKKQRPVA